MKLHGEALRDIIGMVPLLYLIRGTDSSYNRDKGTIHLIYAFLYIYDTAQRFSHGYTNGIPFIDNTGQIHQCLFIYMLQMIRLTFQLQLIYDKHFLQSQQLLHFTLQLSV